MGDYCYDQRLDEDGKKDYPTLLEAKKATVPYMNILIDAINVLEVAAPGTHTALIGKMNAVTTEVMSTAHARKTRKETDGTVLRTPSCRHILTSYSNLFPKVPCSVVVL